MYTYICVCVCMCVLRCAANNGRVRGGGRLSADAINISRARVRSSARAHLFSVFVFLSFHSLSLSLSLARAQCLLVLLSRGARTNVYARCRRFVRCVYMMDFANGKRAYMRWHITVVGKDRGDSCMTCSGMRLAEGKWRVWGLPSWVVFTRPKWLFLF